MSSNQYTVCYCSESGSFTDNPFIVDHVPSLASAKDCLDWWVEVHIEYGSSESDASILIYKGLYDDVTDIVPIKQGYVGPRGGLVIEDI